MACSAVNSASAASATTTSAANMSATRRQAYRKPHIARKWLLEHECNMRKYLNNPVAYLQYVFLKLSFNEFAQWLYDADEQQQDRSLRRLRRRLYSRHEVGAYETPMFQDFRTAIEQAYDFPVKLDFRIESSSCATAAAGAAAAEQIYDSSRGSSNNSLTASNDEGKEENSELVQKWNAYLGSVMRAINTLPADTCDTQDTLDDKYEYKFARNTGLVMRFKTKDSDQTITTVPNPDGYYAELPFNFEKLFATLTSDWTRSIFKSSSSYFGGASSNCSSRCQSTSLKTTDSPSKPERDDAKAADSDKENSDDDDAKGDTVKSNENTAAEQHFVEGIEFMMKFVADYFSDIEIQNLLYNKARYPALCYGGTSVNEADVSVPYRTALDTPQQVSNQIDPLAMSPSYMMPLFNSVAVQSGIEHWVMKSTPGLASFHLVTDADCQDKVLEMTQSNGKIDGSYIICPGDGYALNCTLPYFVAIVKDLGCYFKIELSLRDSKGYVRKIRLCNYMNTYRRRVNTLVYPLKMREGVWYTVALNLRRVCATAFRRGYDRIMRIAVHPNCRLRAIYMANRVYDNNSHELPQWLRLGGSRGGGQQQNVKSYFIDPFSFEKVVSDETNNEDDAIALSSLNAHQQQQYRALSRYSVKRAKIARQWQALIEQQQQQQEVAKDDDNAAATDCSSQYLRRKAISGSRNRNLADSTFTLSASGNATAKNANTAALKRPARSRSIHSVWSNNSSVTSKSADQQKNQRHGIRSESDADLERIKEGCDDSHMRLSAEDLEEFRYHTVGGSLLSSSYGARRNNSNLSAPASNTTT